MVTKDEAVALSEQIAAYVRQALPKLTEAFPDENVRLTAANAFLCSVTDVICAGCPDRFAHHMATNTMMLLAFSQGSWVGTEWAREKTKQ